MYVPGGKGCIALLALAGLGYLIISLLGVALMMGFGQDFFITYGQIIMYPLLFVPPLIFASVKSQQNLLGNGLAIDSSNFGKNSKVMAYLLAFAGIASLAFICDPVTVLLPEMSDTVKNALEALLNGPLWVTLLSVSVFAPIFEEWLFRGMILRGMLQITKPVWAIVATAAAFALFHMNIWQAIPAFIFGCFFGYVYYKTGSLKLTMFMHFVNNTISALVSRIDKFEDMETYMDVIPQKGLYWIIFAAMTIIFILCFQRFKMIETKSETGSCDEVSSTLQ